jgi:hypothetical protein
MLGQSCNHLYQPMRLLQVSNLTAPIVPASLLP